MIKLLFVIIILLLLSPYVPVYAAGTPLIFSYQGRLSNSNGNLLTGTYYFKFSIWDVATGGTAGTNRLWPSGGPSSVSASVREGVFNVNIGDTANGYPDSLTYNFNTDADIFLQVEASSNDSSFETLSPRQRISSAVFAQIAGAVSGTGQSSFGTTSPVSGAIVTVEATTTSAIPVFIRAIAGQLANLFRIENSSATHLFSVNNSGSVFASSTLNVSGSDPQIRLGLTSYPYGTLYVDAAGDVNFLSNSGNGGNIRMQDENLWICSGDSCNASTPSNTGNMILENSFIFDNNFQFKQTSASTSIYDSGGIQIIQFDEGQ